MFPHPYSNHKLPKMTVHGVNPKTEFFRNCISSAKALSFTYQSDKSLKIDFKSTKPNFNIFLAIDSYRVSLSGLSK